MAEDISRTEFVDYKAEMRSTIDKIDQRINEMNNNMNKLIQNQTHLECSVNNMQLIVNNTCDSLTQFQDNLTRLNQNIGNLDFERLRNRDKEAKKEKYIFGLFTALSAVLAPIIVRLIGAMLTGPVN